MTGAVGASEKAGGSGVAVRMSGVAGLCGRMEGECVRVCGMCLRVNKHGKTVRHERLAL